MTHLPITHKEGIAHRRSLLCFSLLPRYPALGVPFYTFYKQIGTSPGGNPIYAKTYVPAIEVTGMEEYFQKAMEFHGS